MTFREWYGLAPKATFRCEQCGVERKRSQTCKCHGTIRPPKVSKETYLLLRMRAAAGVPHRVLAKDYNLTRQSIQRIARYGLKHYEQPA